MINIIDKKECCGCEACVTICPQHCIAFGADFEGFNYPTVDAQKCIDCGLCEKVCPVINQDPRRQPLQIFAAKNNDLNVRLQSSSGGLFTLIAERVIAEDGVVFGAKFDKQWNVVHSWVQTIEELAQFRGSKYVQSQIGNSFADVKNFLKQGRKVLFVGTPCQVAGLTKYLRQKYENLLTVDFICHGVPSPKIWDLYKKELLTKHGTDAKLTDIQFRDKSTGWKKFSFQISITNKDNEQLTLTESTGKNPYMRGFLSDLYLRPSCHNCAAKSLKSGSDITIADLWGVGSFLPEFDDDKGANLLLVNSSEGEQLVRNIDCTTATLTQEALQSVLVDSVKAHPKREHFFKKLDQNKLSISDFIVKELKPSIFERAINLAKRCVVKAIKILSNR